MNHLEEASRLKDQQLGDGRQMYLECTGSGSPTLILESGRPNTSHVWVVSRMPLVPWKRATWRSIPK